MTIKNCCTIYYVDFMIYTIFIYIFNEILFIIYDIITLISDYYIDLAIIVNNNENEDLEVLLLEGVFNALILGLKSSIMIFVFIWVWAPSPENQRRSNIDVIKLNGFITSDFCSDYYYTLPYIQF